VKPLMRRGGQQRAQGTTLPSPMRGVNATRVLTQMEAQEAIFMINILPEDFGCEVRDGYAEWANGWTGTPARTVITFEGNSNAEDRLWVANSEGIWDVTVEGTTAPTKDVAFPSPSNNAGICSYVNYGNDAGDRFLLLCDGENGYYVWTQTTDTWDKITVGGGGGITGADPALFNFVMIWKQRVWFIERDTAVAYFTSKSESFLGAVNPFNFGDQFRFGGPLVSLHNWTLDGGAGIDDQLVGVSGAGDVIIFKGTDPTSSADFQLVGSWYVGRVPKGNRIASEFSGELYILSVQGLLPLSLLLNGSGVDKPETYVTKKIAPYIRAIMDDTLNEFGWHIHIHPKQSLLFVNSPPRLSKGQFAFTLYFGTMAWGTTRGLAKSHSANWKGEVYWTDIERNKVFIQRGFVDSVYIDSDVDGEPEPIEWDLLTSYTALDAPATYKRVQHIRPMFVGGGTPTYNVKAAYDFSVLEQTSSPAFIGSGQAQWGSGGVYIHTLASDGADLMVLSFTEGVDQVSGVTTIDVTVGTQGLATLAWNVPNQRYEGASVGIQTYLISEIDNPLATTINPDTLASGSYTITPAALASDAGFTVPTIVDGTPPVSTPNGILSPSILFSTNTVATGDALWDIAEWAGKAMTTDSLRGASGMGRHIAINMRGRSATSVTLAGFDVIYDAGGLL